VTRAGKALPWLASACIHAAILVIPLGFLASPAPKGNGVAGVDIAIGAGDGGQIGAAARDAALAAVGGPDVATVPRPRSGRGREAPAKGVAAERPGSVVPVEEKRTVQSAAPTSLPSARDVLDDVAALTGAAPRPDAAVARTTAPGDAPSADRADTRADAGQGARISWNGSSRKLIKRRDPQFPDVLAAAGQEVEGEALITVAPTGKVTRVRITKGTGYPAVDAAVENALHEYLFSRAAGAGDVQGTVTFRFRLERQD
jgi:TonB family protein